MKNSRSSRTDIIRLNLGYAVRSTDATAITTHDRATQTDAL
ncbi:hypothetical protein OS965_40055 [Streptomyces sp. H27-G5]|nr:hypothetical protein [Streptomyces sp. H27-G5]MCY0924230.1 hypothetical protein [Streptomyces sp. H27-G5]